MEINGDKDMKRNDFWEVGESFNRGDNNYKLINEKKMQ